MERRFRVRLAELLDDAEVPPSLLRGVLPRLESFLQPFVEALQTPQQQTNSRHYVQGLLSDLGSKDVDPEEWFFKAHFYQDPVCPGSLGLESFLQLLKVHAVRRWGRGLDDQLEAVMLGKAHRWLYRGQVLPGDRQVSVQAVVTAVDDEHRWLQADGFLAVDGRMIYQMNDFTLRLVAGP